MPPEIVTIQGEGIFHHLTLSLPRSNAAEHSALVKEVQALVSKDDSAMFPAEPSPRSRTVAGEQNISCVIIEMDQNLMCVCFFNDQASAPNSARSRWTTIRDAPPTQIHLEHEVERLVIRKQFVCYHIIVLLLVDILKKGNDALLVSMNDIKEDKKIKTKIVTGMRETAGADYNNQNNPLNRVVIGQYLCEFGNVVKGTHKSRTFKVVNTGTLPISFGIFRFVVVHGFYVAQILV